MSVEMIVEQGRTTRRFVTKVVKVAAKDLKDYAVGFYTHLESVGILVLASLGLNQLLGEVPFFLALPAFIEAPLVIPVLAVLLISALIWSSTFRHDRRLAVS